MPGYYYLVAGFPEILQGIPKKGFPFKKIMQEIWDELSVNDRKCMNLIRLQYDCENLVSILDKNCSFDFRGVHSREYLGKLIENEEVEESFLHTIFMCETQDSNDSLRTVQILENYFHALTTHENSFIRQYGTFELNLRNVISAKLARKLGVPIETNVLRCNEFASKMIQSCADDFGLSEELPWISSIDKCFSSPHKLEAIIDSIRWNAVDDMFRGDMFSLESVLSFIVKINSIARWMQLNPEVGLEHLNQLLDTNSSLHNSEY